MSTSPKRSLTPERVAAEDSDTAAARKELGQTAISENPDHSPAAMGTPNTDLDVAKEQPASPKRKRAHDELDEAKDATTTTEAGDASPISATGSTGLNRSDRAEPEKKRPRDVSSELKADPASATSPKFQKVGESSAPVEDKTVKHDEVSENSSDKKSSDKDDSEKKTTSASAFQSSSMSAFATSASPFLQAGGGQTLSSFATPSSSTTQSPFMTSSSTESIFKSTSGLANGAGTSPFGQVTGSTTAFGGSAFGKSAFGTGFGSSLGGKLGGSPFSSFGKPGDSLKSAKPAKPFGAPASDDEGGNDQEADDNASEHNEDDDADNQDAEEDKAADADEKKKTKLQRIVVDDGEAGEATILQVRARLYNLDRASGSWKERGAGNLKINVPMACVEIDDATGTPLPGSFDASALEDADNKVVRLIMRQDSTHRVILNTAIIPTMQFQQKSSLKASYVLFTAIEDEGAVSIQIKMSAANAKSFLNEIENVQHELQSV